MMLNKKMIEDWENYKQAAIYGIIFLILSVWIRRRQRRLRTFEELGIPGPTPNILFGNMMEIRRKGVFECHEEWIQKYGKIVGFYHGMKPVLLISDPDILKRILIKDFQLFSDRPETIPLRVRSFLDHIIPATQIMDSILTNLKGERWKEVRSILSIAFSTSKLKRMIPAVEKVTDVTLTVLEQNIGKNVNIYELLQRLTLDIICAQAFALDIDVQTLESHPLLTSSKTIFELRYTSKIMFLGLCFPEIGFIGMALNFLKMFFLNNFTIPPLKITDMVGTVIEKRRDDPSMRRPDLLQLLIDSSLENAKEKSAESSDKIIYENGSSETSSKVIQQDRRILSDVEIKANALVVFLAGYETISSALGFAFYFLGKYPEYQEKLQAEIDLHFEKEGKLDYGSLNSFHQIENFLLETMRLYPPGVLFVQRIAAADVDYGDLRIPKGMEVLVPTYHMHKNSEYWDNPEEFNPDRFLAENRTNHATTYFAFGSGPRYCIGTRLIYLTSKLVLTKILHKYKVELADPEQETVKCIIKFGTMVPENISVKLFPRNSSSM